MDLALWAMRAVTYAISGGGEVSSVLFFFHILKFSIKSSEKRANYTGMQQAVTQGYTLRKVL